MSRTSATVGTLIGTGLLLLSACGGGAKAVSQAEVEKQVSEQLAAQVGQTPDSVDCPGDLSAEKGTTMRCSLTAGTDTLGVTLTVTAVEGTNVKFDIQVDEK